MSCLLDGGSRIGDYVVFLYVGPGHFANVIGICSPGVPGLGKDSGLSHREQTSKDPQNVLVSHYSHNQVKLFVGKTLLESIPKGFGALRVMRTVQQDCRTSCENLQPGRPSYLAHCTADEAPARGKRVVFVRGSPGSPAPAPRCPPGVALSD